MNKDNQVYLGHILECIDSIESYTTEITFEEFISNKMIQDAVIRNFEVMGEAAKNISIDFKEEFSNIPWKQIAGSRDKLIHHYTGVNLKTIWDSIETDLPSLRNSIEKLLL